MKTHNSRRCSAPSACIGVQIELAAFRAQNATNAIQRHRPDTAVAVGCMFNGSTVDVISISTADMLTGPRDIQVVRRLLVSVDSIIQVLGTFCSIFERFVSSG